MKWSFLFSPLLLLSCSGLIQAPPATPGSKIPIQPSPNSNTINTPSTTAQINLKELSVASLPKDRKWGLVKCADSDQEDWNTTAFNEQIRTFLSASANPSTMNFYVRCNWTEAYKEWKGGFFIKGSVSFQNGDFNPQSTSQNLTIDANSYIELHIVSHLDRSVISPIKMNIETLESNILNSNINLVFKDDKGKISLIGSVKMNDNIKDFTISGDISFTNFIDWSGTPQNTTGPLGWFEIPACSFLKCSLSSTPPIGL